MVWSCLVPKRLVLDGLIKDAVPGAWLWSSNGIPLYHFGYFGDLGWFFLHSKRDDKVSCSGSSKDFTPRSLKSYFLIFLDLQSLLTICNPLGPSGNKCRMQHILLIERFAIKEDSPLHTTKASPGGSSLSSRKNASGSAWQLRFSWFLCRPNTALAPSCSTENRSVKRAKGRKKQAHASFDWLNWLWMFAGFSFISEASLYPLAFLRNFTAWLKQFHLKPFGCCNLFWNPTLKNRRNYCSLNGKHRKNRSNSSCDNTRTMEVSLYTLAMAMAFASLLCSHVQLQLIFRFLAWQFSTLTQWAQTQMAVLQLHLKEPLKNILTKTMVWSFWGATNLQLCWMSQTKPKPCTVIT